MTKFSNFPNSDSELYQQTIKLPFIKDQKKFKDIIEKLKSSEDISDSQKNYLQTKLSKKEKWAKSFTKEKFAGGISTTSRVEGLHSVQKKYLTSSSSLKKVFYSFRSLENQQILKFKEEFREKSKGESIGDIASLDIFKEKYPLYVYKRIYLKYKLAIDYIKERTRYQDQWFVE